MKIVSKVMVVSKVMESVVNDYLRKYLFGLCLLAPHQYGFMPNHSTLDMIVSTTQRWENTLDNGSDVRIIALDISRAFDRVWHNGLLSKLMSLGIGGRLYRWIRDFLSGR